MYENLEDWKDCTSTKEKEEQLLDYLSNIGNSTSESKKHIDNYLFDSDNLPVSYPDVEELFDMLDIDFEDFLEFIS
jgi:CRISPR/Cas system CMR-associated protein Cmr5 small subunit